MEDLPNECCGLLLGTAEMIEDAARARNTKRSRTRFQVEPADHFAAIRRARAARPRDRRRVSLASERPVRSVGNRSRAVDRSVDVPRHHFAGPRDPDRAGVPPHGRELQSAGTRPSALMNVAAGPGLARRVSAIPRRCRPPPQPVGPSSANSASRGRRSSPATTSCGCSSCARARRCPQPPPTSRQALQEAIRARRLLGGDGHGRVRRGPPHADGRRGAHRRDRDPRRDRARARSASGSARYQARRHLQHAA